jgi:hypothetical protein
MMTSTWGKGILQNLQRGGDTMELSLEEQIGNAIRERKGHPRY